MQAMIPLYEAIGLGAGTIEKFISTNLNGCALGMAANAIGCNREYTDIESAWPWLRKAPTGVCPLCHDQDLLIKNNILLVAHLFDSHVFTGDITLERLQDIVKEIELRETRPIFETAEGEACKILTTVPPSEMGTCY